MKYYILYVKYKIEKSCKYTPDISMWFGAFYCEELNR